MLNKYNIKIHFAHRTFKWSNEAKGNAAVHCVIIGFANFDTNSKSIFEYENIAGEAHEVRVRNINPYLIDAKDIFIERRTLPICNVPKIVFGSMPNDGGNFLFSDEEKIEFLQKEPKAEKFIFPLISAHEFLNGKKRWCLWLKDANPNELKELKLVMERIETVRELRNKSNREATQKLAIFPSLFGEIRQPESDYILIPRVSSENRKYIPMGFFTKNDIVSDSCLAIPNGTLYHFGILMSKMHMAWVNTVCGRLESRYRYSAEIVYNNFPFPENPTSKQIQSIERAAQKVLDIRAKYMCEHPPCPLKKGESLNTNSPFLRGQGDATVGNSLADLYDPLLMPPLLVKAHNDLDRLVDILYRSHLFVSDGNRMEFLFSLYEKYLGDIFTVGKGGKKK